MHRAIKCDKWGAGRDVICPIALLQRDAMEWMRAAHAVVRFPSVCLSVCPDVRRARLCILSK